MEGPRDSCNRACLVEMSGQGKEAGEGSDREKRKEKGGREGEKER